MSLQPQHAQQFSQTFNALVSNVEMAIVGKTNVVRLTLACMISRGHLLLEDVPGTGKTMLARSVAATVQGSHSRVQFTPDLLPSDVTGVTIFNQGTRQFEFHNGPIFANVVLADEINRASPKTQSALLEVMEEGTVTVDGTQHQVPRPFMVIATMNPVEQAGTYPLPEAQLDRFLMKTSLGYPDQRSTLKLLADAATRNRAEYVEAKVGASVITDMAKAAEMVTTHESVLSYVAEIAEQTRQAPETDLGVSVRGCLAMVRAAKTWALAQGRTLVTPDDIKQLAVPVFGHRILLNPDAQFAGTTTAEILQRILAAVSPPTGVAA